jgi:serine/threonine-protein kinase
LEDKVFADRYKLIKKLGSGGMADVFEAEDTVLGRTVALKVLHSQFAQDESFIERFRREAQSAAKLTHPNIVSIFDVGEEAGSYYIVMEYVAGTTLKKVIQQDAPLSPEKTIQITGRIAKALEFAHEHEIIHRDIKPQNVMITQTGEIKVTDFGIARLGSSSTMTRTGTILGTAHYISPEQAQGGVVGPASDIYSLGVVMYEMATGELPFRGENPVAVALKHINETPLTPRSVFAAIPENLEAVIVKAMAKNPADRYQSARQLQEDLQRCLEGTPVKVMSGAPVATPMGDDSRTMIATPPRTPERKKKRPKWIIPAVIVGLLLLGLVAFGATYYFMSPSTVVVPDLKGKSMSEAQKAADDAGLKLVVSKEVNNESVKPGHVISQDPAAGEKLKKGSTIKVIISRGVDMISVPNLVGKTADEAADLLRKAGLILGKTDEQFSDSVANNTIISQSPKSGGKVEKGSTVDIVVSRGSETVQVPDVVNNTKGEAQSILENAGFKVDTFEDYSDSIAADHVVRQSPESGQKAKKGSTVTITISKGSKQVSVINLVGMTKEAAETWLTNNSLNGNFTTQVKAGWAANSVWEQDVAEGIKVDKGSTINLKVTPP